MTLDVESVVAGCMKREKSLRKEIIAEKALTEYAER